MYGTRILKRQIGSDARQLENTINRDLVRPFIELNFGPQENYPRFMIPVKEPEDIGALANALDKLVPMGLEAEASVIRDKLGLPDPEDDAELLEKPPAPAPMAAPGGPPEDPEQAANRALSAAAEEKNRARGDRYERALEAAIDAAEDPEFAKPVSEELVGPLLAAARQDPETLLGRLAEVYSGASTRELQAKLGRVLAVANVWGRISADGDR